jgi:hypothetical protein
MLRTLEETQSLIFFKLINGLCLQVLRRVVIDRSKIMSYHQRRQALSHIACGKGSYVDSRDVVVENEAMIWFEIASIEEILELAMQDYEDAIVELAKEEMTTENDSTVEDWRRTMEKPCVEVQIVTTNLSFEPNPRT